MCVCVSIKYTQQFRKREIFFFPRICARYCRWAAVAVAIDAFVLFVEIVVVVVVA